MPEDRVRVVHISDPHIGSAISGGGHVPRATAHESHALEALETTLNKEFRDGKGGGLVVSGDVSARGSADELSLYCTLRDVGFARDAFLRYNPLSLGFDWILDIPGNHDYWNGKVLNSRLNSLIRSQYFEPLPWTKQLQTKNHVIAFHGLCSTSGATRSQQKSAVGSCALPDLVEVRNSIAKLNADAQANNKVAVHFVVTHHSPSYGSHRSNGLDPASVKDLNDLHQQYNVIGLLTGHVHQTWLQLTRISLSEARCGTTLQSNMFYQSQARKFLVHEFWEENKRLQWCVTPWLFGRTRFEPVPADRAYWQ